jgi:lipoate-protein ligase A
MNSEESIVLTEPYDLPDAGLLAAGAAYAFLVWQPERAWIVIGRGNQAAGSVHLDLARADGVPVAQRPSGGEAVILTPRTLVVSAVRNTAAQHSSRHYFHSYNQAVTGALAGLGIRDLALKGISDIALGDRKIAGSSIYRNRERVFFHAVLNVAEDPALMERYLRAPRRQPDYRLGRGHAEFVTSLAAAGYPVPMPVLQAAISGALGPLNP